MDFDGKYHSFRISVGTNHGINSIYNVNEIKEADSPNTLKALSRENTTVGLTASAESVSQAGSSVKEQLSIKDEAQTH